MNIIELENIGKSFRVYRSDFGRFLGWFFDGVKGFSERWILTGVDFSVCRGESIGIVGKNGAGKSTLLKILTGTMEPSVGRVIVSGKVTAILELGMGFNPELTGRENAKFSLNLMGYSYEEVNAVIAQVEEFADIGEYFDLPVRTYSSGMQMRVAFSVATAFRPDILIVDEALSVGDAFFQAKCYKRISDFKVKGTSLLLVSHSMGDVIAHCDRAILLRNGQVVMDDLPKTVSNAYYDEVFGIPKVENKSTNGDDIEVLKNRLECSYQKRPGYNKDEYRWGNGKAEIQDFIIYADGKEYPSVINTGEKVDIYMKVFFSEKNTDIVPGLIIKGMDGQILYGTNSIIACCGRGKVISQEKEVKLFKFSFSVGLNEGSYMLSLGVSSGCDLDNLVPLDRRYDSILINVLRATKSIGILDLNAEFCEC
ncbi:ABC transporter ATP-binding protein [Gelidibacter japonicus]|uniref:ABC transporter ATP-binding protein n=1 Tax=Gelidibacter japonicus TaxID=1962232 RepID=UPI003A8F3AA3